MADRNKELAVNTVILGIGQLVPKFLAIILLPLLTAYLTKEEYGNYDLILSFASLLIPVVTLQIQQAVFRHLLASSDFEDKSKYVTSSLLYLLVSSVVFYPVVFIILLLLGIDCKSGLLICLLFWGEAMYNLIGQIARGLGYNARYSAGVIVYSTANLICTAILLVIFGFGLSGVIISLTLGYVCADIFMIISSGMLKYFSIRKFDKNALKELLSFSVPIVPSSIALWIVNLSDRLIIIYFMGAAANGIYAVANKIPGLYSTVYGIFNLAWTETASRVKDDGNPSNYYAKLFDGLFNFLIGVMLLMIALTPLAFMILVKGDYGHAMYQVPILYFGVFFNSFVNFYSGIYIAFKRTKQVGYSSVMGAVLNAVINITLISKIGLYAASVSTALSFMVIALYRAYDLRNVVKIDYSFKNIAAGIFCFVLSGVCLYLNSIPAMIICWVLAAAYNILKNRTMMLAIIKKFIKK